MIERGRELPASARRVADALAAAGVTTTIVVLEHAARTSAEAAAAVGCDVGQIVKSLVFRLGASSRPLLVLTSGANRVDEVKLGALLGEPIERADADFVRTHTGFAIGGVAPLAHPAPLTTLVDEELLKWDAIWAAGGHPHTVFRLTPDELVCIGGERATERLVAWLGAAGLRPGGDSGTFLQSFTVAPGRRLGPASTLELGGRVLKADVEWTPHGGSRRGEVSGPLAFVDDDWTGDLRDKIVVAAPRGSRLESLILARQRGAAALLLIADPLPTLDATSAPVDLPSAALTRATADALRAAANAVASPATARLRVDLAPADLPAANVIGVLPGTDPPLANETVVLGAHWDHLGASGGAVYHRADDNASGTAVVVGLARALAAAGGARRTPVLLLFGGEELGLIGSGHYVGHAARPLAQTVAMLNFDMVGRMRDDTLMIGGVDSGDRLRAATVDAARAAGVNADLRGTPFSPSDHTRFYTAGTPVLFFHTGGHEDYHRPSDTADKLNVDGFEALRNAIRARRPGDTVRLVYLRDGRDHETSATLERSQE